MSLAELELAAGNHGPAADHLRAAAELHHRVGNLHYAVRSCRNLRALLLSGPRRAPAATDRLDQAVARLKNRSPLTVDELVELIAPDTEVVRRSHHLANLVGRLALTPAQTTPFVMSAWQSPGSAVAAFELGH